MTEPIQSISAEDNLLEPFEDRVDILFRELELATKWKRPSVLLAIYSSEYVRADADIALENRLHNLGQSIYHIKIKNQENADVSLLISELANTNNVVFFVEGLRWGAGGKGCHAYNALNKSREFFIENQVRVVFWLTENEAINLAHHAPDYWSFRHRVIEFVDSPTPEQISPHILESAWQGGEEFTEPSQDLDAKIALRTALLEDLPDGNESTAARANLLLTLGILHWRRGDYEKAGRFLNNALDLAARLEDACFEALCFQAIALVETNLGRIEQAIQAYQNAISLAPEKISAWNALGNLYKKLGKNEEALAAFQKAIEHNASDAMGWNGLGDLYHTLGRNDDAIYAYLKAIEYSPTYPPSWSGLGSAYKDEAQFEQALAAYQKAIELDRLSICSWQGMGEIYQMQGKNEYAGMAYRSAIELDPQNAPVWNAMGDLHYRLGAYDEALHAYQQTIGLNQDCSSSYSNLASIHVHKGCYAEAIPMLQKAIEFADEDTDLVCLWNRLGDAHRRLDNYDNAITAYRKADALDKEAPILKQQSEVQAQAGLQSTGKNDPQEDGGNNSEMETQAGAELGMSSPDDASAESMTYPEIGDLLEESSIPESAQPESISENANGLDETESNSDMPETGFRDWLEGLASVLPVCKPMEAFEETGRNALPAAVSIPETPDQQVEPMDTDLSIKEVSYEQFLGVADGYDLAGKPEEENPSLTESQPMEHAMPTLQPDHDMEEVAKEMPAQVESDELDIPTYLRNEAGQGNPAIISANAHIWNELGNMYLKTEAYDEAELAFQKAIELDHNNAESYNNLASFYFHQGRYADAIPLYEKGLQFSREAKDKAMFLNRLGDAYRRLDQADQAGKAYRKAMELDPENVSLLTRARFSLLGNCRA